MSLVYALTLATLSKFAYQLDVLMCLAHIQGHACVHVHTCKHTLTCAHTLAQIHAHTFINSIKGQLKWKIHLVFYNLNMLV